MYFIAVSRFSGDVQWSETGDRYLMKLFRDHLFHQVQPSGKPWLDLAHIVQTLNKVGMVINGCGDLILPFSVGRWRR